MGLKKSITKIYNARYFWGFLAMKDIKFKYRRSKLGGLWMMIQPLSLTLILAFVFSTIFKQPMGEYAVYIFSGLISWNLLNAGIISGGQSFISAEAYIRQFNHPKMIYTLKSSIVYVYTFLIEFLGLLLWLIFTKPQNLLIGLATLPVTILMLLFLIWELTTIAAYSNAQYYDYPQLVALIMQALYYVSPVFFQKEMFMGNEILTIVYYLNPVTHILNLIREPFLYGRLPSMLDYGYVSLIILLLWLYSFLLNKKNEKIIIFYL